MSLSDSDTSSTNVLSLLSVCISFSWLLTIGSFLVFQRLKLDYPDLMGVFLSLPSYQIAPTSIYADQCEGIYLHEREGMGSFYDILSQCHFVINLADRNTPGRIQGEGAFFEIPVIGSNRLELQNELFPDFAVTPYSLEDAYYKAKKFIEEPAQTREYDEVGKTIAMRMQRVC